MPNEPYDAPQKPFGGDEDYIWSPDGTKIIYVCKRRLELLTQPAPTPIYMNTI